MLVIDINMPGNRRRGDQGNEGTAAGGGASVPAAELERLRRQLEREKNDALSEWDKMHVQQIASMTESYEYQVAQLQRQWDEGQKLVE